MCFEVLAVSATHNRTDKPTHLSGPPGYELWESNRGGQAKGGGGLAIMYSSKLTAHEHHPEVPEEYQYVMNERQWLLIADGKNPCAFLHTYIACQTSRNSSFIQ